jgi:hypothetical protein
MHLALGTQPFRFGVSYAQRGTRSQTPNPPESALINLFTPDQPRKPIPPQRPSIPKSFTYACGIAGLTDLYPGLRTYHCPGPFVLNNTPPHLRSLSSAGITPRLRYYEPLRHPDGPACLSQGASCCVPQHRLGFPCCHSFHLAYMPGSLPRWELPSALVARFPDNRRPSPMSWRIGSHIIRFEACLTFTTRSGLHAR